MQFRYDTTGSWFKGNTHLHSTASDGGKTFAELAELYSSAEYDFLFRTDHWVTSDTAADKSPYPLLWMDGIELDGHDETGAYFHVVCLGKVEGVGREHGLQAGLKTARDQGALLILAHPHWSGNSLPDCVRWQFDGVEIYNHVCHWLNGKSGGMVHWDAALMERPGTLGLAVDDSHLRPEHLGWDGGWIVVNAPTCSSDNVMQAIRRGNFYSSCGPRIHTLSLEGDLLRAETSQVRFARLVGPGYRGERRGGFNGDAMDTITFRVPEDWRYAYLEIEDPQGRRAWTNSLFVES